MKTYFILLIMAVFVTSCARRSMLANNFDTSKKIANSDAVSRIQPENSALNQIDDTTFVNLKNYSNDFVYDMQYATSDNFLKAKVYDCAECYLRYKTVKALVKANEAFMKKGFRIKLYDCYRPLDIQKRMWAIVSNPEYVANPAKGSIHNRGGAVDISLVDKRGKELNMGTAFDFFGKEAGHSYTRLSKKIIKNRILLKTIMVENNFKIFDSEWWHYNLKDASKDKISNFKWDCNLKF